MKHVYILITPRGFSGCYGSLSIAAKWLGEACGNGMLKSREGDIYASEFAEGFYIIETSVGWESPENH